jgi:ABC-type protease/lipase transport system fused ATPase/permease subunit
VIGGNWTAILRDARPAQKLAVAAMVMAFLVNVLALVQPVFMLHVYDFVLPSQSGSTLFFLTIIALFLVGISAVIDALKNRFLQELAWQVDVQLRERAFLGAYRRGLVSRRFGRTSSPRIWRPSRASSPVPRLRPCSICRGLRSS